MGLDGLLKDRSPVFALAQHGVATYRQPTAEELEQKRKEDEEYLRRRYLREENTMKWVTKIALFRDRVVHTRDYNTAWAEAEDATEFLFSKFDGLTSDDVDSFSLFKALGQQPY